MAKTMIDNPKFSIITVCLNAESVIRGALQSVHEQCCRDFECVVIDGASSDRTLEVVRDFGDLPLVISSEPDKGIYDAMNKGISLTRGDILYFLNSDDRLCDAHVLEKVAIAFDSDPELDMLWGDIVYVFRDGNKKRRHNNKTNAGNLIYGSLCHQAVFARKRLFARHGGFDTEYSIAADFDWLLRVLRGGAKYRHLETDIAFFARGGAHESTEKNLGTLHQEMAVIRRAYLNRPDYLMDIFRETARSLKRRCRNLSRHLRDRLTRR